MARTPNQRRRSRDEQCRTSQRDLEHVGDELRRRHRAGDRPRHRDAPQREVGLGEGAGSAGRERQDLGLQGEPARHLRARLTSRVDRSTAAGWWALAIVAGVGVVLLVAAAAAAVWWWWTKRPSREPTGRRSSIERRE